MSAAKPRPLQNNLDTRFHGYERGVGGIPPLPLIPSKDGIHSAPITMDPVLQRGERGFE